MRIRFLAIGILALVLATGLACGKKEDTSVLAPAAPTTLSPTTPSQTSTPPAGEDITDTVIDLATGEVVLDAVRVAGLVRALRGTCPDLGLMIKDQVFRTTARTKFEGQRCAAIRVGDRAAVFARPIPDKADLALKVITAKP